MKRILLIDNYDSFVFNVLHLLKRVTSCSTDICFNDKIPFSSIGNYSHIVLSPGPGLPSEAGDLFKLIDLCRESHSILGICLGHQAIAEYFGAKLINLKHPLHGHKSLLKITDPNDPLVGGWSEPGSSNVMQEVGLYHSWAVSPKDFPECLSVGSVNEEGIIMSLYHRTLPLFGVQFHPESVISVNGERVIRNWFNLYGKSSVNSCIVA
ncbi:MAG: aminodeoxychorismate/anthranilate synthase component II [Bacteroidales bacterium]|nr:aminodeoxychorismate/anthranilate synthase component II [Bacteroidales bacterium]